jgi:murein DD-endopeptidase MepM/ murein hydrolase activator NlpD
LKTVKFIICLVALSIPFACKASADRSLPVDTGRVTSGIGWRIDPFGSGRMIYHRGVDIAVPTGSPVFSVRSGTVLFAGNSKGYGNLVVVDHGDGFVSFYGHNSALMVSPGQRVDSRKVIALSGNTGRSTGPHVHYELGRMKDYQARWSAKLRKAPEPSTDNEFAEIIDGLSTKGGPVFSLPSEPADASDLIALQPDN